MTPAEARRLAAKAERERFERMFEHQLKFAGVPFFVTQFHFAKELGRQWAADYAWPKFKLLVEIDGGLWRKGGGAHSRPTAILRDMQKHNDAALLGFHVLRFSTDDVKSGTALRYLERVLASRGTFSEAMTLRPAEGNRV